MTTPTPPAPKVWDHCTRRAEFPMLSNTPPKPGVFVKTETISVRCIRDRHPGSLTHVFSVRDEIKQMALPE